MLLASPAFAQLGSNLIYNKDVNAVNLTKTVTPDASVPNKYWIDLSAYVTGKEIISETVTPTDFTFVVDLSGSMKAGAYSFNPNASRNQPAQKAEDFYFGEEEGPVYMTDFTSSTRRGYMFTTRGTGATSSNSCAAAIKIDGKFYSLFGYETSAEGWCGIYTKKDGRIYFVNNDNLYECTSTTTDSYGNLKPAALPSDVPKLSSDDNTTVICSKVYSNWRMTMAKSLMREFAEDVYQQSLHDGVNHRISLIKFGSARSDDSYYRPVTDIGNGGDAISNYTQVVKDFTDAADYEEFNAAVNSLYALGGTATYNGVRLAKELIDANSSPDRNRVVVIFTDGNCENNQKLIDYAKALKDEGVSIFVISICMDAYNENFDYCSSNYPDADWDEGGVLDIGGGAVSDKYYTKAGGETVKQAFDDVLSTSLADGNIGYKLTSSSVVLDVLADDFSLPAGTSASDIEVYTADYKRNSDGTTWFDEENKTAFAATTTIDGQKISVSNFDFSDYDNFVRVKTTVTSGGVTSYEAMGKELLIRIPIVPSATNAGGYNLPTNTEDSGIYDGDTAVKPFGVPSLSMPNILIKKTGMSTGDRSVFRVEKLNGDGTSDISFMPIKVSISGNGQAKILWLKEGRYKVTQLPWNWSYTNTPDVLVKDVNDETADEHGNTVYEFSASSKTDTPKHSETSKTNTFSN